MKARHGILTILVNFAFWLCVSGQQIIWEDISVVHSLPEGVKLMKGTDANNADFFAYYYKVDLSVPTVAVRPYLVANSALVHQISNQVGAFGAINGGYFSGGTSVSSVIYPGQVKAINVTSVVRNGQNFPLIRPMFSLQQGRQLATNFVYHHSFNFEDIYTYVQPLPYACNASSPLPAPTKAQGSQYNNILFGLGGGPQLLKNGVINITYCEEIFWGSGVLLTDYRPRTAVGHTPDNKAILFVTNSMRIPDIAELMLGLGCSDAINLDGGGSTAISVGGQSLYHQNRAVPSILAVVHSDSLNIPPTPTFTKVIDTSDEGVSFAGNWFPTANPGSWQSPSMLHGLGNDSQFYLFPLNLPASGQYEIYGWWTASANRSTNTPFVITHANGTTTVPMNQTQQGSTWAYVGSFQFNGSPNENVTITAAATTGSFVVADAIRIVSYDPSLTVNIIDSIVPVQGVTVPLGTSKPDALSQLPAQTQIITNLGQNFLVDLQWDAPDYNGNLAGVYQATGVFELPEGVLQSNPPTSLSVNTVITVEEPSLIRKNAYDDILIHKGASPGRYLISGRTEDILVMRIFSIDGKLLDEQKFFGHFTGVIQLDAHAKGISTCVLTGSKGVRTIKLLSF